MAQIASWEATELAWINKARVRLLQDLDNTKDPLVRVKLISALDTVSERKRIVLGLPMPGVKKSEDKPGQDIAVAVPVQDAEIVQSDSQTA